MSAAAVALATVAGFALLQLLAHHQAQAAAEADQAQQLGPAPGSAWDSLDLWGFTTAAIESRQVGAAVGGLTSEAANVRAFLAMIEVAEGTGRGGRDPYRTCYGYRHTIQNLSEHPAVSGEWRGESLASLGPQYAGKVSTAAGRYQIIRPTWVGVKRALDLPDFSPDSQDRAAVYLIKQRGALGAVQAGQFARAVELCRQEWASLPGAGYGQPERQLAELQAAYTQAGGTLA